MTRRDRDEEIRAQLVSTLESGHNHMSLAEATRAFPLARINARPPKVPYTFWHLVEHIRLAQRDMLDYMTSSSYEEPPFPEGYWPDRKARATPAAWRRSLAEFHKDLRSMIDLVGDPGRDLFAAVPNSGGKHTVFRCGLVIADHNSYHIGELGICRQVAGLWPKNRRD